MTDIERLDKSELLELRGIRQYNRALAIYRQDHDNFGLTDFPKSRNRWLYVGPGKEVIGEWIRTGKLLGICDFTLTVKFFVCPEHPMGQCTGHDIPFRSGYKGAKMRVTKDTRDPNIHSVSLFFGGFMIEGAHRSNNDADWIWLW